jgi:CRISPR-associated endonuclease Csn1
VNANSEKILGVDLGIASCGWAVIEAAQGAGEILAAGVWCWEAPETAKDKTPKNQERRQARGQRRVISRRRQRMQKVRRLFHEQGMLSTSEKTALAISGLNPWQLRVDALDRMLTPTELAVALAHIARHRGFRSNSKRDHGANAPSDTSKMLQAMNETREALSKFRTVGEMVATAYPDRKRNRDGEFSRTILRKDHEDEVRTICARQRALGSAHATSEFEQSFADIAFSQRPLGDSWDKVGPCPFERGEKRTAKRARAFELFRFLSRLTALRVGSGRDYRPLTEDEIQAATADFAQTKKMTFKRLREVANIDAERFQTVPPAEESKLDVVARSGNTAEGTWALKGVLEPAMWSSLLASPEKLDHVAEALTFLEATDSIRKELDGLLLDQRIVDTIMRGVEAGKFDKFSGAGHISAKAARNIIPHLMRGLTYDKACAAAGYRHTDRVDAEITNPVARKALLEAEKQIRAIVAEFGIPDKIHIELARDIGKSAEERDEIRRGIEKRNKEKDKIRDTEFPEIVGRPCQNAEDLLRFELWKQQAGRCLYTDTAISPSQISASDNSVQVDHILPWSRFSDDSFHNRTLCLASANQEKRGRTPFEWFRADKDERDWEVFRARVEACKGLRGLKKRNLLLQNADEVAERFVTRNLNDTRYAARALMARLESAYPPAPGSRRVFARPGPLTDKLRRAWGINDLKKDPETGKRREDDRHHCLDAIVVAATSESTLNRLTRAFQEAERKGLARDFAEFQPPWKTFTADARARFEATFVARAEIRRARGKAHDATIKQIRDVDGAKVVFERKDVARLKIEDLDRIPVPEPHGRVAEPQKLRDQMVEALRAWIDTGKPKDTPPRSAKGDVIRKVRLATTDNVAVDIRSGMPTCETASTADRGDMVRVDVFAKANARGRKQFYLVPVYPHEVATLIAPPDCAVPGNLAPDQWQGSAPAEFLFSIYSRSYLETIDARGVVKSGYFVGLDRSTGAINLGSDRNPRDTSNGRSIGARTLTSLRKFSVDRFGQKFEVQRETRTWRGEACT